MPLSEKARVEVYIPDAPLPTYANLLNTLQREFTYAFGGCTVVRGLSGSFLSRSGSAMEDRINVIYTDAQIRFDRNLAALDEFTEKIRRAAFDALREEAVLVAAYSVYHSTGTYVERDA